MSKKILVVDDASLIRHVAAKALKEAGFEAVLASNGQEGLNVLEQHEIDFIFSDINMPIMSGMEMVRRVRKNDKYRFIPIVMLTTETKMELQNEAKELGVKAWLVKPFNKDKFLLVLSKILG
ncbi:response regulator [Sulfurimonas sp.]|jgi:two-component system chemotaxis response regulator CheY|uniref:response regulator n=1 Tax=Sulfurimonas sp. TaxID=2022749 RepID=UPI0025D42CE0|nr:response regulator [Sulfurimonas sp.]MBT5933742.1 response regulator [Sulfurimonas sp.]